MARFITSQLSLFFISTTLFNFTLAGDTLTQNQPLRDGETLVSSGGSFALGFFTPTGSKNRYVGVWYNTVSVQTAVWVANRQNPITSSTGSLTIASNGSLIITDVNGTVYWSTPATNSGNPIAQLLDSANFVVRDEYSEDRGSFDWQSFDYPTDQLLPGMKLGWNLKSGLNRNLTSWTSPSDPSPGAYTLAMDIHGVPQIYVWSGPNLFWRAGSWDGVRFAGMPEMNTFNEFNFTVVDSNDEVYYMFQTLDDSVISRLLMNYNGVTQRVGWLNQTKIWNVLWYNPKDPCDTISACGPYGLCSANDSPICSCLQGFVPKSPANWALRDGSDGCVRKTALDCGKGTDGFVTVKGAKVPDTRNATVNMSMDLSQCRAWCLSNCSCTAYASANVSGTGSGCVTWTGSLTDLRLYPYGGQDLYVRLAAADLGSYSVVSRSGTEAAIVIAAASACLGVALATWAGCCIWRKKKRRRALLSAVSFTSYCKVEPAGGKEVDLPVIDMDTIAAATGDFCLQNKLGEGGFGPVFKGTLGGQDIAVKRLAKTSVQGLDEFMNEVRLIAKLQHRNLVRLLGCCIQGEERMLTYEYMPNSSLDAFLFDKVKAASLNWETRYHIISGIARGLLYLHQDSRYRIIHRDLKASNILLDKDMNPKISDFGLARMFGGDETEVNTRRVVGTFGYMSPEYAMDGKFSVKSDVFSFGVLLLEIISGKRNRGIYLSDPSMNLIGQAWNLWNEGNGLDLVDDLLGQSFHVGEALRCIKVGLLCVQECPKDRPAMSNVVLMLGSDNAALPHPHPKKPGFVVAREPLEMDISTPNPDSCIINGMTITIMDGR